MALSSLKCPHCKRGQLSLFHSSNLQKTYECDDCHNVTQVLRSDAGWRVITAGGSTIWGSIAILKFFGIEDWTDFIDLVG
jgi:uncharacterized protein (DUF983 family)